MKDQHDILSEIIDSNDLTFADDSPQWLLWQQQKDQGYAKKGPSMVCK